MGGDAPPRPIHGWKAGVETRRSHPRAPAELQAGIHSAPRRAAAARARREAAVGEATRLSDFHAHNRIPVAQLILESCRSLRCTCSCTALALQNPRTGTLSCHRALLKIHRAPLLEFQYSTVAVSVHALAPLASSARSQYRYLYHVLYRYSSPSYPPTGTALYSVLIQL